MTIKLKVSSGQHSLPPVGNWVGCVDEVYELGLQPAFKEGEKPRERFALVVHIGQQIESGALAGQPHRLFMTLTGSTYKKSRMFKVVKALVPGITDKVIESGQFDLEELRGKNGLFDVHHVERNGQIASDVQNVSPLPSGIPGLSRIPLDETPNWVLKRREQRLDKPDSHAPVTEAAAQDKVPFDEPGSTKPGADDWCLFS